MDKPMPRTVGGRAVFGREASFWIVAITFGLFLFAAAAPSPLYAVYAGLWQFSAGALTEVFAVYAIALLVALLFTGSSSDFVGRRPIILVALVIQLASIVLFLVAALAAVTVMPEPGARRSGVRWVPRISVERAVRREFVATLPILVAGWAVAGFYLSLGPSLASQLAASSNRVLGGLAIFLLADIGAVAIVITRAWATTRAMIVGGIILGAGLVVAVAAIALT